MGKKYIIDAFNYPYRGIEKEVILTDSGAIKLCYRSILEYMAGNIDKSNKLAILAEEKNKNELWNSCKITIDGKKIDAKINLLTKEVYDLNNNLLRRY